jgi:translation initiation factor 2 alpha subunit (eIF-2alpha)
MAKSKTKVKASGKGKNWDSLWSEYTNLLKKWTQTFESLQKISSDIQTKYNDVMQKAINESSEKTLKEFYQNWQKSMNDNAVNAFKEFGKNWEKVTSESGMEQLKAYGELMDTFAQTWQKMWRK